ncbi:MAG: 4'-phosphopantetheinyl transferase superfamily protein [Planctomycetaceae bacterium]|nr:4'-phosphopantetheinyl transferase superfamily protein [Planctomycetaceae bacterium]
MLTSPFPNTVAFRCYTIHDELDFQLHEEEQLILSDRAVEIRRIHFTCGRAAAHHALQDLTGRPTDPILTGPRREPLWPSGIVGAISHSGEIACAAVANHLDHAGIGLDIELLTEKFDASIARLVCTPSEAKWIASADSNTDERVRLLQLFCAKECVYKAFFPLSRIELTFQDAELTWNKAEQLFRGRLMVAASHHHPPDFEFKIGCKLIGDYVFASLVLPAIEKSDP